MAKHIIAVYPGSFDPVTNGHLDIIERAVPIFDRIIVAVGENLSKKPLFTVDERMAILKKILKRYRNIEVDSFSGLLITFARTKRASVIVRGLRAVSDYDYEFQLALTNRMLDHRIETIFIMTRGRYSFLSSGIAKEIAKNGGDVRKLVPATVERVLKEKFRDRA
ncbi:TPA: pantetheine-phosphate adenylyltransferase [Candidatus Woesearchaeota archaeon]|nr:pantetheine-phosphate adenylyltransferase [Candidatus Woesearchaeota archaeon]HII68608.1 pantetheine-phosphate adenylyltransferase [Candidatus Woesearchaeota archaeon]